MPTHPRTRLNRLLLAAIVVMTLAILALGAAIIWKLFFAEGESDARTQAQDQRRTLTAGTARLSYTLPEGCQDAVTTGKDRLTVRFIGESCEGLQTQASGLVSLSFEE